MDNSIKRRDGQRSRRTFRVRKKVRGSAEKPRLTVCKSNQHLSVQMIDDEKSMTIASVSTLSKEMQNLGFGKKSKEAAKKLGLKLAETAKEKKIEKVVFDRGRYKYHGLIAELANAAREGGLQF